MVRRIFDEILNGGTPVYDDVDFNDIPQKHLDEIGRNWGDYEIETHINHGLLANGYKWTEKENDFILTKEK